MLRLFLGHTETRQVISVYSMLILDEKLRLMIFILLQLFHEKRGGWADYRLRQAMQNRAILIHHFHGLIVKLDILHRILEL